MGGMEEAMLRYYGDNAMREHQRLDRPDCGIEFAMTTRLLARHLPGDGRILDVGGGSGRYARWLASRGYRVTMTDVSPTLLDIARQRLSDSAVEEVTYGDARDLTRWRDGEFDAVIALGPFYHLTDREDRIRALNEALRVLNSTGILAIALISRYSIARGVLMDPSYRHRVADPSFLSDLLHGGVFVSDLPNRLTGVYGVEPTKAAEELTACGFKLEALYAIEGFVSDIQSAVVDLEADAPVAYGRLLDLLVERANDPSLLGMSNHLLLIASR